MVIWHERTELGRLVRQNALVEGEFFRKGRLADQAVGLEVEDGHLAAHLSRERQQRDLFAQNAVWFEEGSEVHVWKMGKSKRRRVVGLD